MKLLVLLLMSFILEDVISEYVPTDTTGNGKEKVRGDPFGIIALATLVGKSLENYSVVKGNDKGPLPEQKDVFKRKSSDWKIEEDIIKIIGKKEFEDLRAMSSNRNKDTSNEDRRNEGSGRERSTGQRFEFDRRNMFEEGQKLSNDSNTSYNGDLRQHYEESRYKSNDNRPDRFGSSEPQRKEERRGRNTRNKGRRGRIIHRIDVINKLISPHYRSISTYTKPSPI